MDYTFKSSGDKTRPEREKPVAVDRSPPARSRSSSFASTASFASAVEAQHENGHTKAEETEPIRFSPQEEEEMVEASHSLKAAANKQFAGKDYSSAISTYDKALAELPAYLDYELAVLQSNIAACHLQLKEWKEAVESAERGLDNLERELPMPKPKADKRKKDSSKQPDGQSDDNDSKIIELPDDQDDEQTTQLLQNLTVSDKHKSDITRIRTKLLLRRARAKVVLCDTPTPTPTAAAPKPASYLDPDNPTTTTTTPSEPPTQKPGSASSSSTSTSHWSNLSTALSDYQTLSTPTYFPTLPTSDQKTVLEMLHTLPPRVEAAKKAEVDEMMGKLKQLGNGILKPFGLSTDMFKMVQDPGTGGWSECFVARQTENEVRAIQTMRRRI
ncbi:hypothetical protein LTR70_001066 [Exophiala xenobiotica]|uniref:Uncharacterized protein n=1 Tax=Lithohypha guttulata TaxID=1690604 RepID=A0ABR0KNX7_9EURO|nr:hypothetical protein LTR24_000745 [Lithohypha guttulata]KAK5328912.1 hypothetical protein LTR70_001066 [Exophiala xenobiotica]